MPVRSRSHLVALVDEIVHLIEDSLEKMPSRKPSRKHVACLRQTLAMLKQLRTEVLAVENDQDVANGLKLFDVLLSVARLVLEYWQL